jgi:manganese-dependent ADP-ribose/CDP-alcohol diphosphatase
VIVVGNHCLYAGRDVLESQLGIEGAPYYATDVSPNWTVIVLDTVHVGVDRPQGDPRRLEADKYLRDHGEDENAVPWNGGLGVEQTAWLRIELAKARSLKKRVIVCGHHPIVPEAAAAMHTIWNASEVRKVLSEYKEDVVAAYFAGHYHDGGYALVDGIHHVTFPAILDSDPSNVRLSNLEAEKLSGDSTVERWQNSNSLF